MEAVHKTNSELAVRKPNGKKPWVAVIVPLFTILVVQSILYASHDFRYFTSSSDNVKILHDNEEEDAESESCLRPRSNSDAVAKSPLQPPCEFTCVHYSQCTTKKIDSYAQMDNGPDNLVQVSYLNEIVGGVPNATFILTFRDMANWYKSMTHWHPPNNPESNLRRRFENANITGLPKGVGRNVSEFSAFYCEYVKRVRKEVAKYPGHNLIEIDIEDATAGWQLEEAFGTNHTCWGKQNVAKHHETVSEEELQRRY